MKYFVILLTILLSFTLVAQNKSGRKNGKFHKRFHELEKIKLLESLDLNEETSAKFITRRNKAQEIQREYRGKIKQAYSELESALENEESEIKLMERIASIGKMESIAIKEKNDFIKSLNDLLTTDQIAKVVLFEHKFKKDIRDLLLERGRKKYFKKNTNQN